MSKKFKFTFLCSIVLLVFLFTGCGGGTENPQNISDDKSDAVQTGTERKPGKILIDAGHFQNYNEAEYSYNNVSFTYCEGNRMWKLQEFLVPELRSFGFEVDILRTGIYDYYIEAGKTKNDLYTNTAAVYDNIQRGERANGYGLFIQLHSNAGNPSWDYVMGIYPKGSGQSEIGLLEKLTDSVKAAIGIETETVLKCDSADEYALLRTARKYCKNTFILENGFHTNPETAYWLNNDENLKKLAKSIAKSIAEYYGVG